MSNYFVYTLKMYFFVFLMFIVFFNSHPTTSLWLSCIGWGLQEGAVPGHFWGSGGDEIHKCFHTIYSCLPANVSVGEPSASQMLRTFSTSKKSFQFWIIVTTCWFFSFCFVQDESNEDFLSISRAMDEIVDDPVDCYWLIKCFVNQFHIKFGDSLPHLVSIYS